MLLFREFSHQAAKENVLSNIRENSLKFIGIFADFASIDILTLHEELLRKNETVNLMQKIGLLSSANPHLQHAA